MGPLVEVVHGKLCVESGDGRPEGLINSPCLPRDENGKDKSTPMLFRSPPFELAIICAFDCSELADEVRLATR